MMETLRIVGWSLVLLIFSAGLFIMLRHYTYRFCSYAMWVTAGALAVFQFLGIIGQYSPFTAQIIGIVFTGALGAFAVAVLITGILIFKTATAARHTGYCDYLIVLGCTVDGDRPSKMLQYRIDAAYRYLTQFPRTKCIVTGANVGKGNTVTEARCMFNSLTAMGIDPNRIVPEEQAATTMENLTYSAALLNASTVAVLSSEFHLYRVEKMAKRLGLTIRTVSAETKKKVLLLNNIIREIPAIWFYLITGG